MVVIEKKYIHHIPILHIVKQREYSEVLPVVFFLHGFTSMKERNLQYAYLYAEQGFRVILPDAKLHGERAEGLSEKELGLQFWDIVMNSVDELGLLKSSLLEDGLIDSQRIGVAGTSMGAITTFGALAKYDWIKTGVSLMGNPAYERFALWQLQQLEKRKIETDLTEEDLAFLLNKLTSYDLSKYPEKMNNRPILFWHGKLDSVVPLDEAYQFYKDVKQSYEDQEKVQFIIDPNAGHNVPNQGVLLTADWFDKHL